MICVQGDRANTIYFINSGLIKCVRKIAFLQHHLYYRDLNNQLLSRDDAREIFKVQPLDLGFKALNNKFYQAEFQTKKQKERTAELQSQLDKKIKQGLTADTVLEDYPCYKIKSKEVSCESIELFQLGSFQVFGVPFPVKDNDNIEIGSGTVNTNQVDFIKDKLNYTAVTGMTTEIFKFDLEQFMQIVTDANLANFRKSLTSLQPDG